MPPDTTKTVSKRREKKPVSPEEIREIEQKRLRGELSCAECRRLKLRCDKKVPCSSCVRRGCESICPCGILEAGVGTRFILASTNQLHSKISAMSARIRALEDGLAIMQSAVSSEKHPLLSDDLLKIKFGAEVLTEGKLKPSPRSSEDELEDREDSIREETSPREAYTPQYTNTPLVGPSRVSQADTSALDTLGTLTLGEEGELKYFGRSAGSETLMLAGEEYLSDSDSESGQPFSPPSAADKSPATPHATPSSPLKEKSPNIPPAISSVPGSSPDALPSEIYALALGSFSSPPSSTHVSPNPGFLAPPNAQELPQTLQSLLSHFPPSSHGRRLAQSYLDHAAYFFRPLTKWELFGDITLPPSPPDVGILGRVYAYQESKSGETPPSPHLLSTLFFIFALGAFFDLSLTPPQPAHEAERWFRLGRSALVLSGELLSNSASAHQTSSSAEETVCALGLMATYIAMTGKKYSRDHAWCGMSLAVKVAEGAGLHRDPARWNMDPRTVQRRRALWWEVFSADVSHSLALGRPPSVNLSFMDCEFPTDEEATIRTIPKEDGQPDSKGKDKDTENDVRQEIVDGFWRTKYRFSRDCFMSVINATLTAKAPSYETVLELDRKVRESQIPIKAKVTIEEDGEEVYHSSSLALVDFYGGQYRTVTMLYLHRSFFAHAMLTSPSNPFLSPFAPSFLAAYRAASMLVKAGVQMYDRCPQITGRVWFLMYHVFSAAVVVGTVVTRSPNSTVASSALVDLNQAVELFEKCSSASHRIKVAFILLKKLHEKALRSYSQYMDQAQALSPASPTSTNGDEIGSPPYLGSLPASSPPINQHVLNPNLFSEKGTQEGDLDIEGELEMFGGQTKVLRAKAKCKKTRVSSRSPSISTDNPTSLDGRVPSSDILNSSTNSLGGSTRSEYNMASLDPNGDLDLNMGSGAATPVSGKAGFDPSMAFGFGAGTTGTVMGGLSMASMGLDLGMDVDTDVAFDFSLLDQGPGDDTPGKVNTNGFGSNVERNAENAGRGRVDNNDKLVNPLVEYLSGSSMTLPVESPASWVSSPPQWSWQQNSATSPVSPGLLRTPNSQGASNQWTMSGPSMFPSNPTIPPDNNITSSRPGDPRQYDELYVGFLEFLAQRARANGAPPGPFPPSDSQGFRGNGTNTQTMTGRGWNPPTSTSTSSPSPQLPHNLQQWYSQFGQRQAAMQSNISHLQQADEGIPSFRQDYDLLLQTLGLNNTNI